MSADAPQGAVRGPENLDLVRIPISELRKIRHPDQHSIVECELCLIFEYAEAGELLGHEAMR